MHGKYIIVAMTFLIFIAGTVSAAHWIVGYVNNATDYTPAAGHKVLVYKSNTSNNVTVDIDSSNVFLADCELLPNECGLGDKIFVKVIDTGDGYTTQVTEVTVSEFGHDTAPNATLTPPSCPKTGSLLSLDAKSQYKPGDIVSVSGLLINSSCKPVGNKNVAIEVKNFSNNTPIYVNQTKTAATGIFDLSFLLVSTTPKGVYRITAASFETNSARYLDFEVCTDCDKDGFSENDCNDNNNSINPAKTEVCGNGIDEDCSGSDLTCPVTTPNNTQTTTTTTTTSSGGSGGGGSGSTGTTTTKPANKTTSVQTQSNQSNGPAACNEVWVCNQWGECVAGERKRDCVDQNSCGTTSNKPRTSESCTSSNTTAAAPVGAGITGLAIGSTEPWILGILAIVILIIIYVLWKKFKSKPSPPSTVSFSPAPAEPAVTEKPKSKTKKKPSKSKKRK
ncbi:MAG: hypothetical protein HY513_05655 [Candidatus Aenigmarchaeota archaeon]|nr:hypothetical protein [Candidatus Aenigmarchaeota archaeon]